MVPNPDAAISRTIHLRLMSANECSTLLDTALPPTSVDHLSYAADL